MIRKFGQREETRPSRAEVTARRGKTSKDRLGAAIAKSKAKKEEAKRPGIPRGWMKASIEAKIEELREKEKWSFRGRHGKTDFYTYLEAVYQVQDWHGGKALKRWSRSVARLYRIDIRKNTHPIRIIIDGSCDQDRRVKSRWTLALEYAVAKKTPKSEFMRFLRKNGGPAGCAAKMARLKRKRDRSHAV